MKQKLIVAGLISCIAIAGCKSRFTSTSDSSGPRKHDHADPSFAPTGNTGRNAHLPIEILDSGRGNQMNTHTDSINGVSNANSADTTQVAH